MSEEQFDRNRKIARLYKQGWSYSKLAKEFNLSIARIRQIIFEVRRINKIRKIDIQEIKNACDELGCDETMNGRIQNALKNRKLDMKNRWRKLSRSEILNIPHLGDKAANIIEHAQKL